MENRFENTTAAFEALVLAIFQDTDGNKLKQSESIALRSSLVGFGLVLAQAKAGKSLLPLIPSDLVTKP